MSPSVNSTATSITNIQQRPKVSSLISLSLLLMCLSLSRHRSSLYQGDMDLWKYSLLHLPFKLPLSDTDTGTHTRSNSQLYIESEFKPGSKFPLRVSPEHRSDKRDNADTDILSRLIFCRLSVWLFLNKDKILHLSAAQYKSPENTFQWRLQQYFSHSNRQKGSSDTLARRFTNTKTCQNTRVVLKC